jgi:transposase
MAVYVRGLTDEEFAKIERIARSETAPVRLARRARIILLSAEGKTVPVIAKELGFGPAATRLWVHRFNEAGSDGLEDGTRSGRPPTYTEDNRSRVIAKARSLPPKPEGVDVPPSCHWTLAGLTAELNKEGLPIKRSQIRRILKVEHIKWQKPRSWLESDDPEFAEKRGRLSASTPVRRRAARS